MSEQIDIDSLLEELVKNVSAKLDKQQKEIDQLKCELTEVRSHLSESSSKLDKYQDSLSIIGSKIDSTSSQINSAILDSKTVQNGLLEQFNKLKSDVANINSKIELTNHNPELMNTELKSLGPTNDKMDYLEFNKIQDQLNKLQDQINELSKRSDSNPQKIINNNYTGVVNLNDLTQLPAYNKSELFKEIRRPTNLNELYMMVLQSQRTINELQMNVDNICRRN